MKSDPSVLEEREAANCFVANTRGDAGAVVCVRLVHDSDKRQPARNLTGTLASLWPEIDAAQARGYGVFMVINPGGHRGADIERVCAVWVDADDVAEPTTWHLEPDMIVGRSEKRWHAYWLTDDVSLEDFGDVQRRLAKFYGTDPSVSDLPRIMRLPGTLHQKGEPQQYRLMDLR